jgi:AcrR family transcriptional regulator
MVSPQPNTLETRQTKGEQTSRRVLDAAEALFAERGFEATSLRAIARAAGIQQPGLYNYFSSKEALYAAVLDRALRPLSQAMDPALWQTPEGEIRSTLTSVMTDLLLEHPTMAALFQRALQGDPKSLGNLLVKDWLDRLFRQAMSGLQEQGEAPADPIDLALEAIAMFNLTTGYFLSQRIVEALIDQDIANPEIVARQKALLERVAAAIRVS